MMGTLFRVGGLSVFQTCSWASIDLKSPAYIPNCPADSRLAMCAHLAMCALTKSLAQFYLNVKKP